MRSCLGGRARNEWGVNNPVLLALLTVAGVYVGKLWLDDVRAARRDAPNPNAFPGATDAPGRAYAIAVAGAVGLVAVETWLEARLGLAAQQTRMTWLAALYSIAGAPIIEELIFRGWIVVQARGRVVMWVAAVGASAGFAVLHPFLWRWDEAGFALTPTAKGWFSTAAIFAGSVWFYAARLGPWNPSRSLGPCFAAHAAKNAAVVATKGVLGFVAGAW